MDVKLRNYVWHGQFAEEVSSTKAWLNADLAALPRTQGGLAVSDLRAELYALAAVAVSTWAETGTYQAHVVGDVLFHHGQHGLAPKVLITPEYTDPSQHGVRRSANLRSTGRKLIAQAGLPEPTVTELATRRAAAQLAYQAGGLEVSWEELTLSVDATELLRKTAVSRREHAGPDMDRPRLEWLEHADVTTMQITSRDGQRRTLAAEIGLNDNQPLTVADIATWIRTAMGKGVFRFKAEHGEPQHRARAEKFATTMLVNFLDLLTRCSYPAEVRFDATPMHHPVIVTVRGHAPVEAVIHTTVTGEPWVQPIHGGADLRRVLAARMQPEVAVHAVHPHPSLSRLVCLWVGRRRWTRTRREYKERVAAANRRRGAKDLGSRLQKWQEESPQMAVGIARLEWKRIRRVVGLNPWGEQLLLRLKLRAFSLFDTRNDKLGCPHAACLHLTDVDLEHVFWGCPATRTLRRRFLQPWRQLGMPDNGMQQAVFGMTLKQIPAGFWARMATLQREVLGLRPQLAEEVTLLVESSWRIGVAIYIHAAWRWRGNHFDELNNITEGHHVAILNKRLRAGYDTVQAHLRATPTQVVGRAGAKIVGEALRLGGGGMPPVVHSTDGTRYILYVAGRTAGTPRTGASRAIIVSCGASTTGVSWVEHMSYASSTPTHVEAEHLGLLMGLKASARKRYWPLWVVSSNSMLVEQHRQRKPPKASRLAQWYWRFADRFGAVEWVHHEKASNRMAQKLAREALESRTSVQLHIDDKAPDQGRWRKVLSHLEGDMVHWATAEDNAAQEVVVADSH
jgi:ribonuclease HI